MTYRRFNKKKEGLERDSQGHRTGIKLMLKLRRPMQREAFERWGLKQRTHIAKSKFVWVYYHSTKARGIPNGIPIDIMRDNKIMVPYLIDLFALGDNETYAIHGWTEGRTKTHVKLTKPLAIITVHNADTYQYTISKDWRLGRMWFRQGAKKTTRNNYD